MGFYIVQIFDNIYYKLFLWFYSLSKWYFWSSYWSSSLRIDFSDRYQRICMDFVIIQCYISLYLKWLTHNSWFFGLFFLRNLHRDWSLLCSLVLILLLLDKFGLHEITDSSSIREIWTSPELLILSLLDFFLSRYGYHYGKGLSSQSAEIPSRMSLSPLFFRLF